MAKRSQPSVSSNVDDSIAFVTSVNYTIVEQSVKVVSKFPATISIRGQATGKLYEWKNAGSVVEVSQEDVADLLTKKIGNTSCCGNNQRGNLLFELV